ncbi:MAG: hypothetical protein HYX78_01170 [Armatimonadetes bacterium]|nr:hypothetical protein [Armatimonadota bacterium]
MKRIAIFVICITAILVAELNSSAVRPRLFPQGLTEREWVTFRADGLSVPVTGVIYRGGNMLPGMSLGGLGTGFISLGTDGTLDYASTIFNQFFERRAVAMVAYAKEDPSLFADFGLDRKHVPALRLPFAAVAVDGETTILSLERVEGVRGVKNIDYWGHYPAADIQFDTDDPVRVSMRAWSPFLPGDADSSNTPGAVFEMRLRNSDRVKHKVTAAFSFNGVENAVPTRTYSRNAINGRPGVRFIGNGADSRYKLPIVGENKPGEALSGDPAFTIFFAGIINRLNFQPYMNPIICPISWGGGTGGEGSAVAIETATDRLVWTTKLDWSTGCGAVTADGSFRKHYGKPAIICVRRIPGPINRTTDIWIDGEKQQLSQSSSSSIPNISHSGPALADYAAFYSPNMVVGDVLIYNRALSDSETQAVGSHLEKKYNLATAYVEPSTPATPNGIDGLFCWFKADVFSRLLEGDPVDPENDLVNVRREHIKRGFTGVSVSAVRNGFERGCALGIIGDNSVRFGGALGADARAWNGISEILPAPGSKETGSSVAADLTLKPGESKTLRFILAWYAPYWKSTSPPEQWNSAQAGNPYMHAYAARLKSAVDAAQYLARNHRSLLERILSWQEVVYSEKRLPGWLQDALINILAVLPQQSLLVKSPDPDHWWGKEAFFSVTDSILSCPQQCCVWNHEFGEWPVSLLFPELALRALEAFKRHQRPTGQTLAGFGPGTEPDRPWFDQYRAMDCPAYVNLLDRYRLSTGDDAILKEWYLSVKAGMKFMFTRDEDNDGLPDVHGFNYQFMDWWPMEGAAVNASTYWLATLEMAERMARLAGDDEFAQKCVRLIEKGRRSFKQKLWNGNVGSYFLYNDPATGKKSDTVCTEQLCGDARAIYHGLPPIIGRANLLKVLAALERLNVAATKHGVRLAARPDGGEDDTNPFTTYITPGWSTIGTASVMARSGDPHFEKLGLEIVRRTWRNIVISRNMAWDQPALLKVDGTRGFGMEYYHNTMLWAFPLAVLGQDIRAACSPGGFVERVRAAGQRE